MMVLDESAEPARKVDGIAAPTSETVLQASLSEAIVAGLQWLSGVEWSGCSNDGKGSPNLWLTACVLARLAEIPSQYLPGCLNARIEQSLDFLEQSQVAGSGWSHDPSKAPDAFTTAWAIIAFRACRRRVAHSAVDFLLSCRHSNGGFSAYPVSQGTGGDTRSCAEITVTALRALNMCDRDAGDFLTSRLRNELSSTLARKSSRFYICSEVLDWEGGLAPWPLLSLVSQSAVQFDLENAYDQALLLRMLLRFCNQRAPLAATALQKMQLPDGSWPSLTLPEVSGPGSTVYSLLSFEDTSLVASVTALSALVMNEVQPELYYRSDLLRAVRLGN